MASNGLLNRAKKGTCRMCLRVRCTDKHVKTVGEVRHGYATGYIWQCKDVDDCEKTINRKLSEHQPSSSPHEKIKHAISLGRW